jgi:hypothetical protein
MRDYGVSPLREAMRSAMQMSSDFQAINSRFRTTEEQVRLFNNSVISQHTIRNTFSEFIDIEDGMMDDILADAKPKKIMAEREPTTMEVWRD